jgi:hypothetical protein
MGGGNETVVPYKYSHEGRLKKLWEMDEIVKSITAQICSI